MSTPISYAVVIQYTNSNCIVVASAFSAPMQGQCLPVGPQGYYVKSDFIAATDKTSTSVFTPGGYAAAFPLNGTIASGDKSAQFSFTIYSDSACTTVAPISYQISNVPGG